MATPLVSAVSAASSQPFNEGFTPSQLRNAYGLNSLPATANGATLDGTGETIAIVDAYNDPTILQDLNGFDQRFSAASTGATLYQKYGAAASFLTVVNQNGQTSPLPSVDPAGAGNAQGTWEQEIALDVEWAHAAAPGAKILLVESNSDTWADCLPACWPPPSILACRSFRRVGA